MMKSIKVIIPDGAVTWASCVLCNEGANDALIVFIEMLAT